VKRTRFDFTVSFLVAFVVTALLLSASRATADVKPGSGPCVIKVTGIVGAPELIRGTNPSPLQVGAKLVSGDVIVTNADERAVISFGRARMSPERLDLLLVAPNTEVAFTVLPKSAKVQAGSPQPAPIVVDVRSGAYQAVIRGTTLEPSFSLATRGRAVTLTGADMAGTCDARADNARYMVNAGMITITHGARKIRVRKGMARTIDAGKVRGARKMPAEDWSSMVAAITVPGTDVSQTQLVGVAKAPSATPPGASSRPDRITSAPSAPPTNPVGSPKPAPPAAPGADVVYVRMKTTMGDILLALDAARAPISVANFLAYADKGYYAGTIFHRVIGNFMIQGGGFDADLKPKVTAPPIKNEWQNGLKNVRGTIAMARTRVPDSATSQFYINVVDNASLDAARGGAAYAVFGRVVGSMETVDAIRDLPTKQMGSHGTVPQTTVTITGVDRITAAEAGQ